MPSNTGAGVGSRAEGFPVDVHYAKLQPWLEDREGVLRKRAPTEYALLHDAAPRLLQMMQAELPAARHAVARAKAAGPHLVEQAEAGAAKARRDTARRATMLADLGLPCDATGLVLQDAIRDRAAHAHRSLGQAVLDATDVIDVALRYASSSGAFGSETGAAAVQRVFPWLAALAEHRRVLEAEARERPETGRAGQQQRGDSSASSGGIDWGDAEGAPDASGAAEIDWGDDDAGAQPTAAALVASEHHDTAFGWSDPPAALTLDTLGMSEARGALRDELVALAAFMRERALGLADTGTPTELASLAQSLPAAKASCVPHASLGMNASASACVALEARLHAELVACIGRIDGGADARVAAIAASHQALEQFVLEADQLRHSAELAMCSRSGVPLEEQLAAAKRELTSAEKELAGLEHRIVTLRDECEAALRRMFAPRAANLIGDINAL